MSFTEGPGRAGRFSAAPDPHQPSPHSDPAEARRVMQHPNPAAVTDSHHPAGPAGLLQLTRLDRKHQALLVIDLNVEDMHVGDIEDRIGSGAPARARATHRVSHRSGSFIGAVAWSLLILRAPTPSTHDQHAASRRLLNHAHIRRASKGISTRGALWSITN